ncbi:MAG: hypothetical protein V7L11_26980 [Nostoc sp.]
MKFGTGDWGLGIGDWERNSFKIRWAYESLTFHVMWKSLPKT